MNILKKIKNTLYLIIISVLFISASCQRKDRNEFVQFIVQPEVELGKSIDFSIYFREKPDSIWSSHPEINGLELTNKIDNSLYINESQTLDENDKVIKTIHTFYTYAKPTKLGVIEFPILSVRHKGIVYETLPFSINVVEEIKIEQDAVKAIWSTAKTKYKKTDTIKLHLHEYAKFSKTKRSPSFTKNHSLSDENTPIKIGVEETIDNIVGIDNFEEIIDQRFEIIDFDWDLFKSDQTMEKIGDEVYIKTLILEISLLPKTKGSFEVGPSGYDFFIYKSNTDFFNKFVPNDKGGYSITENGSTRLKIKSNKLKMKII